MSTERAAKQATTTIPIVMAAVGQPDQSGLVASLARPGGNVTGLSIQDFQLALKGRIMVKTAGCRVPTLRVAILVSALILGVPLVAAAQPPQDVTVVNPPGAPVPVQEVQVDPRAGSAFQVGVNRILGAGVTDVGFTVFTVPAGVRLVIEYLTSTMELPPGETAVFSLFNTVGGVSADHTFQSTFQSKNGPGLDRIVGNHPVRLYADSGTQVRMFVRRRDSSGGGAVGTGSVRCALSGYFVSFP